MCRSKGIERTGEGFWFFQEIITLIIRGGNPSFEKEAVSPTPPSPENFKRRYSGLAKPIRYTGIIKVL